MLFVAGRRLRVVHSLLSACWLVAVGCSLCVVCGSVLLLLCCCASLLRLLSLLLCGCCCSCVLFVVYSVSVVVCWLLLAVRCALVVARCLPSVHC